MAVTPIRYILDTNILVYYVRGRQLGPWIEARYRLMSSPVAPLICAVTLDPAFLTRHYISPDSHLARSGAS